MDILQTGYLIHKIEQGDTLFALSRRFNSNVDNILVANPGIDAYSLRIGQEIIIPTGDIVNTDIDYTYQVLQANISSLKTVFPFISVESIGVSILEKELYCLKLGTGSKEIFLNASIHANEWITTPVLMKFIEDISNAYVRNQKLYGQNARTIFETTSIYVVPMINPDGVDLVTGNMDTTTNLYKYIKSISGTVPFPSRMESQYIGHRFESSIPCWLGTSQRN